MPLLPLWCPKTRPVTVLCPVKPERLDSLKATLEGLPNDPKLHDSPLLLNGRTHFGRWVVMEQLADEDGMASSNELSVPYLLFTSNIDGPVLSYLRELVDCSPDDMHKIWSHCIGYEAGNESLVAYLRRNRIRTSLFFAPYGRASIAKVQSVLVLRTAFIEFAVQADSTPDDRLASDFHDWYARQAKKVSC